MKSSLVRREFEAMIAQDMGPLHTPYHHILAESDYIT
jgi:hypothetical protein